MTPAPTLELPDLLSILPCYSSPDSLSFEPLSLVRWYQWWVYSQLEKQPRELFSVLPNHTTVSNDGFTDSFVGLWQAVSRIMITEEEPASINTIVAHLQKGSIMLPASSNSEALLAKHLVFAVIGWQTMLYRADMNSCPPSQLAIDNEMGVHQGQARMCLKQSQSACSKPMHDSLLGFGVLLPPRNFHVFESPEDKTAFNEFKTATAKSFNAHLLAAIGGVNIEWVDSLACHLEFDVYSNTLFLFRYPSFCAANIPSSKSGVLLQGVMHCCAAPSAGARQWATADEVSQMLEETILSYRLLFGQNKAARHFFRKLSPFEGIPEEGRDEFLVTLSSRKHSQTMLKIPERESYDLIRDFPVLRSRLMILLRHLSNKKPRTLKELWRDKRDSGSWLTFWAVLIIGGLGVFLAFIQVILQIIQLAQRQ